MSEVLSWLGWALLAGIIWMAIALGLAFMLIRYWHSQGGQ